MNQLYFYKEVLNVKSDLFVQVINVSNWNRLFSKINKNFFIVTVNCMTKYFNLCVTDMTSILDKIICEQRDSELEMKQRISDLLDTVWLDKL
jgi:hypothetical protein